MGKWPGTWALVNWKMQTSFVKQWALGASDDEAILAFWIRASEHDRWTFGQLQELLDSLIDEGEIPAVLQDWALDVAARRRQASSRRGPKGDPSSDFRVFFESLMRQTWGGESLRSVHRDIALRRNRSPGAIESAAKRGRQSPPSA